jgi:hypothetical protein
MFQTFVFTVFQISSKDNFSRLHIGIIVAHTPLKNNKQQPSIPTFKGGDMKKYAYLNKNRNLSSIRKFFFK